MKMSLDKKVQCSVVVQYSNWVLLIEIQPRKERHPRPLTKNLKKVFWLYLG